MVRLSYKTRLEKETIIRTSFTLMVPSKSCGHKSIFDAELKSTKLTLSENRICQIVLFTVFLQLMKMSDLK